ncbi:hypothetical protein C2845_PM17G04690 [Panicum miliaceum]|uniref:Uncharacterized protein n=1 Tax=Panicum miliaceum TaxID=4540 RepID=A0A3L6Q1L1_PANMI|nr:hypothetical protein C2845_PM17G04690 [Panicum miliaceum]
MLEVASHDPIELLSVAPEGDHRLSQLNHVESGNTCLHISSTHGHQGFCMDTLALNRSLLSAVNADGETPLLTAVASGHTSLASFLLRRCRDLQLREAILKQDERGYNALHHAIRSGHRELALELIAAEPALSEAVNNKDESPMFMAVKSNFEDVFKKLLEIPGSTHGGARGYNALHAAVRNDNSAQRETKAPFGRAPRACKTGAGAGEAEHTIKGLQLSQFDALEAAGGASRLARLQLEPVLELEVEPYQRGPNFTCPLSHIPFFNDS